MTNAARAHRTAAQAHSAAARTHEDARIAELAADASERAGASDGEERAEMADRTARRAAEASIAATEASRLAREADMTPPSGIGWVREPTEAGTAHVAAASGNAKRKLTDALWETCLTDLDEEGGVLSASEIAGVLADVRDLALSLTETDVLLARLRQATSVVVVDEEATAEGCSRLVLALVG